MSSSETSLSEFPRECTIVSQQDSPIDRIEWLDALEESVTDEIHTSTFASGPPVNENSRC